MIDNLKVAVVSHGKDEEFFLSQWVSYYGKLFGYSNLYFVKDRSAWDVSKYNDLINIEHKNFPNHRTEFDMEVGRFMSEKCASLLSDYDIVIRVDVDEFIFVDPMIGNWSNALNEVKDKGYMYCLGFDVVHVPHLEPEFDITKKVFDQRSLLRVNGTYCKAHLISEPVNWVGPCHNIPGSPFQMSSSLCMAHLALIDRQMFIDRVSSRGDLEKASRRQHVGSRLNKIDKFSMTEPYDSYELLVALREGINAMTAKKGHRKVLVPYVCSGYKRNATQSFFVRRPEHFKGIL